MKINPRYLLIERLKKHEGFRSKAYKDITGHLTIGYGRNLDANGISEAEGLFMLMADIDNAITQVESKLSDVILDLSEARTGVLYEMAFNMGIYNLLKFKKTLRAIKDKDYDLASIEMMDSKWAVQVGRRAVVLSNIMHTNSIESHTDI